MGSCDIVYNAIWTLPKDDDSDEEVPAKDSHLTDAAIDSPTRDYLKAVSVPKKKKTTRKQKRAIKDDGKISTLFFLSLFLFTLASLPGVLSWCALFIIQNL